MRHFSSEVGGLRLLMEDELSQVSGGEGEDSDELPVMPPIGVTDRSIEELAGGNAALQVLWGVLSGAGGGLIANFVQGELEAEQKLASKFDPSMIVEKTWSRDTSGHVVQGWFMSDQSVWWDRNGNGRADERTYIDITGNLWIDKGDGPVLYVPYVPGR